jgi:anti-sigma B factor antagonist
MYVTRQAYKAGVIEVDKDLDIVSSPDLAAAISAAEESMPQLPIVVSLEHCPYCDSTGLAVLVRAKSRLGAKLAIVVPPAKRISRVFEVTGLIVHLSTRDSLTEALDALALAPLSSALPLDLEAHSLEAHSLEPQSVETLSVETPAIDVA